MSGQAFEIYLVDRIADRLRELTNPPGGENAALFFKAVLGTLEAAVLETWPQTPTAVVLPLADDADESVAPLVEEAAQQYLVTIGVSILVAAPNDRKGALGLERLSPALAYARAALSGWAPGGLLDNRLTLSYRRGRLLRADGGRVQWQDEYQMSRWARGGGVVEEDRE